MGAEDQTGALQVEGRRKGISGSETGADCHGVFPAWQKCWLAKAQILGLPEGGVGENNERRHWKGGLAPQEEEHPLCLVSTLSI